MANPIYRVGDRVIMNSTFSRGSRYVRYAGRVARVNYNNWNGSYDLEFGKDDLVHNVSSKMFCSVEDFKTPEQKREVLEKNLTARRKDAEKIIEEKQAVIVDIHNRLLYLKDNPAATEIDETAYTAWKIASAVQEELDSLINYEVAGGKPLEKGEFNKLISFKVYNILKTTNK